MRHAQERCNELFACRGGYLHSDCFPPSEFLLPIYTAASCAREKQHKGLWHVRLLRILTAIGGLARSQFGLIVEFHLKMVESERKAYAAVLDQCWVKFESKLREV
jgi:hypothetical protein